MGYQPGSESEFDLASRCAAFVVQSSEAGNGPNWGRGWLEKIYVDMVESAKEYRDIKK